MSVFIFWSLLRYFSIGVNFLLWLSPQFMYVSTCKVHCRTDTFFVTGLLYHVYLYQQSYGNGNANIGIVEVDAPPAYNNTNRVVKVSSYVL